MIKVLCASPRCTVPGRHLDDCEREQCPLPRRHEQDCEQQHCRGCAPALAADGSRLCGYCTRRVGRDAVETARLWYEIGLVLNGQGANGTPVPNPHPGLALNGHAANIRAELREGLIAWCKLIAADRGIYPPGRLVAHHPLVALPAGVEGPLLELRAPYQVYEVDGSQHALGAFIARHGQWLAGSRHAAQAADELRDMRTRAWAAAYPEGASIFEIGSCPETQGDGLLCGGTVRAVMRAADSKLPNRVVCDADSEHVWTSERWRVLGRAMGKLWGRTQTADVIALAYGKPIGTIYWLASTHKWRSIREGRRSRYFTDDVARTLEGTTA